MRLTPREFQNMMIGHQEKRFDELEMYSVFALMMRSAYHTNIKKRLKPSDLFDRKKMVKSDIDKRAIEERAKKADEDMDFLQTLNFG